MFYWLILIALSGWPHVSIPLEWDLPAFEYIYTGEKAWTWDWVGPEGGRVFYVAVDPSNPNLVYGVTFVDLWRYTSDKGSWSISAYFASPHAVIATVDNCAFYIPKDGMAVFYTNDGGSSWQQVLELANFYSVTESHGPIAYIAGGYSLYKTVDGGATWVPVSELPLQVRNPELLMDFPYAGGSLLYAVAPYDDSVYVYRVTDDTLWELRFKAPRDSFPVPVDLEVNPTDPAELYLSPGLYEGPLPWGILVSNDGGVTWSSFVEAYNVGIFAAQDVEFIGDTLLIGDAMYPNLWRAYYDGVSWQFELVDTLHYIADIEVGSDGTVWCATCDGFIRSDDYGHTFYEANDGFKALMWHPYLGMFFGKLQVSEFVDGKLIATDMPIFLFDKQQQRVAFASNALYFTDDGGRTWYKRLYDNVYCFFSVKFAPSNPQRVYATGFGGGFVTGATTVGISTFFRSNDGGQSFSLMDTVWALDSLYFNFIVWVSPTNPERLIAGKLFLEIDSVYVGLTEDGGETWTPLGLPMTRIVGTDDVLLGMMSMGYCLYMSHDLGQTWDSIATFPSYPVWDIEYDATTGRFYALTGGEYGGHVIMGDTTGAIDVLYEISGLDMGGGLAVDTGGRVFVGWWEQATYLPIIARIDPTTGVVALDTTWGFIPTMLHVSADELLCFAFGRSFYRSEDALIGVEENVTLSNSINARVWQDGGLLWLEIKPSHYVEQVDIEVFDVMGRRIDQLVLRNLMAGKHHVKLNVGPRAGVYFLRIRCDKTVNGKFIVF